MEWYIDVIGELYYQGKCVYIIFSGEVANRTSIFLCYFNVKVGFVRLGNNSRIC